MISGKVVNIADRYSSQGVYVWHNGTIGRASDESVPADWVSAYAYNPTTEKFIAVRVATDVRTFQGTTPGNFPRTTVIETAEHRKLCGFVALNPDRYGLEENGDLKYVAASDVTVVHTLVEGMWEKSELALKNEDVANLVVLTSRIRYVGDEAQPSMLVDTIKIDKNSVPAGAAKVHANKRGQVNYVDAGVPVFKTLTGGRAVHPAINNLRALWEGCYEFATNLETRQFGSRQYYELAEDVAERFPELQAQVHRKVLEALKNDFASGDGLHRRLLSSLYNPISHLRRSKEYNKYFDLYSYTLKDTALLNASMTDYKFFLEQSVRSYGGCSGPNKMVMSMLNDELRLIAEMQAEEAPVVLTEQTVETAPVAEATPTVEVAVNVAAVNALSNLGGALSAFTSALDVLPLPPVVAPVPVIPPTIMPYQEAVMMAAAEDDRDQARRMAAAFRYTEVPTAVTAVVNLTYRPDADVV